MPWHLVWAISSNNAEHPIPTTLGEAGALTSGLLQGAARQVSKETYIFFTSHTSQAHTHLLRPPLPSTCTRMGCLSVCEQAGFHAGPELSREQSRCVDEWLSMMGALPVDAACFNPPVSVRGDRTTLQEQQGLISCSHHTAVMAPLGLCHTLTSLRGPSEASLSPCVLSKSPQQQWKWWGASQVGQWLRFHAPHAGNTGLVPGGMTRFCLPQLRPVCSMAQSCLALHNPMDCSPPGSSVHGISRARILEQVAISFSRETSWPVPHCQHHLGSPTKIWCGQTNFLKSI